jgi:uncharacterized protein (TIGR02594 family)
VPSFSVILGPGDSGDSVKLLQLLLRSALKPPRKIAVDGDFGKRTEAAVKAFQKQAGLPEDGEVGPVMWTALGMFMTQTFIVDAIEDLARKTAKPRSWMDIAKAELGVSENALPGQHNARIVEYQQTCTLKATTDETPWCSTFVNWVMQQAGYTGTNNALARSWATWGRGIESPEYGCVTVIKKKNATSDAATGSSTGNHVAFFVKKSDTTIRLLGGNQGDKVKYSTFMLAGYDIIAYRLP